MPDDDEWDVFPSLVIRRYAKRRPLELDDDDKNNKLTIEKYHKHPLKILNIDDERIEACDLCTRPINKKISSSFYKCSDIDCHFAAHNICADTLPILNFFLPIGSAELTEENRAKLCPDPSAIFFNSIFYCLFCHRPCNGLSYCFPQVDYRWLIDLECMAAPSMINHASHAQHLLFRTTRTSALTPLTCCPHDSSIYDVYRCMVCDYYIHIRCATLPKRIVRHEYDEHPLHLVFDPPPNQEMIINCFCEICEKDIDIKYWSYRCGECDKWFHVNCIPNVGYLSKVKFGGTLSLDDHLMSLTRMLTLPTQRCGYCKKLIQGYVDEMAFSCSLCHFWIHFSCARDHSSTSKPPMLPLYSEVDDQWLCQEIKVDS